MVWCKHSVKLAKSYILKEMFLHLLFYLVYYDNQNENKISWQWNNFRSVNIPWFKLFKLVQKNEWENDDWKFPTY